MKYKVYKIFKYICVFTIFVYCNKPSTAFASLFRSHSQVFADSIQQGFLFDIDDSLLKASRPDLSIKPFRKSSKYNNRTYSHIQKYSFSPNDSSKHNYLIITTFSLIDSLSKEIRTYAEDVHAIYGYGVYVEATENATPEQLKSLIVSYQNKLCGVIFIGSLGEAFFETDNDYGRYGYTYWPCDLYFMDLDGNWVDNDGNGIYDEHTGNQAPDIFFGRLSGEGLSIIGTEVDLIRMQLHKSHSFWWNSSYNVADTTLNYVYLDWIFEHIPNYPALVFQGAKYDDVRMNMNLSYSATDYKSRLNQSKYGFTHLAVHSSSFTHDFLDNSSNPYVEVVDILGNNSQNIAYNLFCCSACNWTGASCYGYLGGAYLFNQGKTIAVIGSTKTGGMKSIRNFYINITSSTNIGDSFLRWWKSTYGEQHVLNDIYWSYGMTILGDPTLNTKYKVRNQCETSLNLLTFPTDNYSNLILYKAAKEMRVSKDFSIPPGVHVIFDAPKVLFEPGFSCQVGSTFETRCEGCEL